MIVTTKGSRSEGQLLNTNQQSYTVQPANTNTDLINNNTLNKNTDQPTPDNRADQPNTITPKQ